MKIFSKMTSCTQTMNFNVIESNNRQTRGKQLANAAIDAMNDVQAIQLAKIQQERTELKLTIQMTLGGCTLSSFKEYLKELSSASLERIQHERHIAELCSYPPCKNPPKFAYKEQQSQLRIDRQSLSLYNSHDKGAFCSDTCKQRANWAITHCVGKKENDFNLLVDIKGNKKLLEEYESGATITQDVTPPPSSPPKNVRFQ